MLKASAGSVKFCRALRMPISRPLTPKIATVTSMIWVSEVVSACCDGLEPGSRNFGTITGAQIAVSSASALVSTNTLDSTALASRHAPSSSPLVMKRANTGMNDEPSAPPATSVNSASGMRCAA